MAKCKILVSYPNAEGWQEGDVVDITNPYKLIEEGKVELYVEPKPKAKSKKAKADSADADSKD